MTNIHERIMTFFVCWWLLLASKNSVAKAMYHHPGETQPITVEAAIGADFNITCYMNPKAFPGKNSTSLYFVNGRTNDELPRENIIITNSSTIVYMVHNASEQQTEYRCKCGPDAIMETKVFVGSRPRPGKDFSCHSYDFDHMICNFTKPPNPILTTYNVTYYNDMPSYVYQPHCNYDDRSLVVCNTSLKDRYQEFYHFIIESSNALVKPNESPLTQHFDVNNFDIMIPSKPGSNIRIESLTVDSIKLAWQMPNWEKYRLKGLQWEVLIQPENSTALRRDGPVREHNELRLRLNNLPYAYWHYELKLRVRVKNPFAIWSDQLIFPFRTAARRPQRSPLVQPGSFYIDSMETLITIYWEELLPFEYNGDNFTYAITSVQRDGKFIDVKPFHQEINLAKFAWQKDSHYEFEIRSRNHMGDSTDASRLTIYPLNQRNPKKFTPQAIHNVYHANDRTYTLTWSKPENITGLSSFTVYWCYPKRALPNECRESMFFQQIPAHQLNFTTEKQNALEEHTLNLAVSANYDSYNTGLHWTDCTSDVNADLVKMDPDILAFTNSIKVLWSVERVCPSILDGFNITYCEVANDMPSENATCLHKPISKFAKKNDKKYNIIDLKPFTMYKISMFMFSRKHGKPSDPKLIRTLESAPSPPRQLRVDDLKNTSATIKWLEPSQPNGKIRKYIIMLNNDKIEVNSTTLTYHFENLDSFTAYKVYVLAETVETSVTSNDVHFTTAIGYPSPPGLAPSSNNASIIQWMKPAKPNGRIEFYEVSVTQMRNKDKLGQHISRIIGDTACVFTKVPTCIGAEYKTTVEVRAVNAALLTHETTTPTTFYNTDENTAFNNLYNDNDDLVCEGGRQTQGNLDEINRYLNDSAYRLYKSPWQTSAIYSCSTSRMSKITTIALVVVAMSLGVMAALYMARKKYNKMANINCTLPAGLETYFTKETGSHFPADFGGNHNNKETRIAEDQWISAARMHEFNLRNEHHHLLSSLGNDSGYLGDVGGGNKIGESVNGRILSSSLETANTSEDSEQQDVDDEQYEKEHLKERLNSASSSADSLVESTEGSECHNTDLEYHEPLTIFPNNNGYVKQSMLQKQPWQNFNDNDDEDINVPIGEVEATTSGYITVQNLNPLLKPQSNVCPPASGYVLQQDLQHFFNNLPVASTTTTTNQVQKSENVPQPTISSGSAAGGYTTLDDLTKLNINSSLSQQDHSEENAITNHPQVDGAIAGGGLAKTVGISGYVTQHDLNIFAQHQQHH